MSTSKTDTIMLKAEQAKYIAKQNGEYIVKTNGNYIAGKKEMVQHKNIIIQLRMKFDS